MKPLQTIIACLCLLTFLSCANDSEPSDMTVDNYVELLKKGKYEPWELPNFTAKDIPMLLAYRNESQLINNFPINMISSYMLSECTLGMYVLWTVESIRARSIDSEHLTGTFPSQNPVVENRADYEWIEQNEAVRATVAESYFQWWDNNKNKDFNKFKEIDPLAETELRWH